ncbi:hypothetical protein [Capnocytophaga sp.]|uniref:hypothetical protein n=1 Tax=Capnocytophaga sp. TaxID=44737 RepID=UPI0026DA92B9|nr:hypothetical protein [Capnocytophaga sp.]MDO5105501.1 hypothetical protein [Capnocytophaga sp.]
MTFTKHFLGVVLLLCLLLPNSACKKEQVFQEKYRIGVQNHYFEMIDSVKVGEHMIKNPILVGEKSFFDKKFSSAYYLVHFYTSSNLIVQAKFNAISHQDTILLALNSAGKIIIK